jgi:hypothetical protein
VSGETRSTALGWTVLRVALALVGVVAVLVGVRDLVDSGWEQLRQVLVWLVVGNLLHDVVLAPLVVSLGVLMVRVVPTWARTPVVAGFVVLGATTLLAIPVLGNFGNEVTNPSLMPRDYWSGWAVVATVAVVGVLLGAVLRLRRQQSPDRPPRRTVDDVDSRPERRTS